VTHYYEDTNPINELRDILTPKLVLNAVDDVSALPQSFICHYVLLKLTFDACDSSAAVL
jgi:predicted alpha/beta-fold hydrolase